MRQLILVLFLISNGLWAQQNLTLFPGLIIKGDPYINELVPTHDGGYLLASRIDHINGEVCGNLAKVDAQGNLINTFNKVIVNNHVIKMVVLSDRKILAGGWFDKINGTNGSLVRLNSDGSLDNSFQKFVAGGGTVNSFVVDSNGKIVVIGSFNKDGYRGIIRLNEDGTTDHSFHSFSPPSGYFARIALGHDGNFVLADGRTVYKLDGTGSSVSGFPITIDESGFIYDLAVIGNKTLIAGSFTSVLGADRKNVAMMNADGSLDSFSPIFPAVSKVVVISDSEIGILDQSGNVMVYNVNGTRLATFASFVSGGVFVDDSNKVIVSGGNSLLANGLAYPYLARFNNDFTTDNNFKCNATYSGGITAIVSQPDGKILIGADYSVSSITANSRLARINSDGSIDESFVPEVSLSENIQSLDLQSDKKVLVCTERRLLRLNKSGSKDNSLLVEEAGVFLKKVKYLNEKIFLAGQFNKLRNQISPGIICLNIDGTPDQSFISSLPLDSYVAEFAFQTDGKIVLAGLFQFDNGLKSVVRLNSNGSVDDTFIQGAINYNGISRVAIDSVGRIYISGTFVDYNGQSKDRFARLLSTGEIDSSYAGAVPFDSNTGVIVELLAKNEIVLNAYTYYGNPTIYLEDDKGNAINKDFTNVGDNSSIRYSYFDGATLYFGGRIVSPDQNLVAGVSLVNVYPVRGNVSNCKVIHSEQSVAHLTWSNNINKGTLLIIERSVNDNNSFSAIDSIPATATYYDDSRVTPSNEYFYRIKAINTSSSTGYFEVFSLSAEISQVIDFSSIDDKKEGEEAFTLKAMATSGLPIVYTTLSDKIGISGSQVTIFKPGRATIIANQPGNNEYQPAAPVSQSFCINPKKPMVNASNLDLRPATLTSSAASGNQWYLDGSAIDGAVGINLVVSKSGVYSVQVKADDCLSDFSDTKDIFITGDIKHNVPNVTIYPNPTSDLLNISFADEMQSEIILYGIDGRILSSFKSFGDYKEINLGEFFSGIYLIKIITNTSSSVFKVVKK